MAQEYRADPFAYLGMHRDGNALVLRTSQPRALNVRVRTRDGKDLGALTRLDDDGLYEIVIKRRRKPFDYVLEVEGSGGPLLVEDPYRFGPLLGDVDSYLIAEGNHRQLWRVLGAHCRTIDGVSGTAFAVWAPNALRVSVVGDFNEWDGRYHPMRKRVECGVWEIFIPGVAPGTRYKFELERPEGGLLPLKSDPLARYAERPPAAASIVEAESSFEWTDAAWMERRGAAASARAPISIYEVHLGSWRRRGYEGNRYLSYDELSEELLPYVSEMGFTHVELLPITEHPFDGSWGYQPTGMFAPTSRYGTPDAFRRFVDTAHRLGIGVILDWVPGHFPSDPHGLAFFDGTYLYEYGDPRKGFHPDWNTLIYNHGRREVANFLIASALYWIEEFHIDGLRVDAVASMLYLDYSRREGEWVPNARGGRENLDAIEFLKRLNHTLHETHADAVTIAEESTSWPLVTGAVADGGLGFGYKWNMGWMHDSLRYLGYDPVYRRYHQNDLTFGLVYAFSERFVLPLSHDEVVHGKRPLVEKMPGDRWQRFANVRLLLALMTAHPGKKLLFMGDEIAAPKEWNHDAQLDWDVLDDPLHAGVAQLVRDCNRLYRATPSLYELDCEPQGFQWITCDDSTNSVLAFLRLSRSGEAVVVAVNATPVVRYGYRIGVPKPGTYREVFNSDSEHYGGSNVGNEGSAVSEPVEADGHADSLSLTLPPLAVTMFARDESEGE